MKKFEMIDDLLYKAKHIKHDFNQVLDIWDTSKDNRSLLWWAIGLKKDKFGQRNLVNGLAICDIMLEDYQNVNKDIYNELIQTIFSNEQIARIVIDGASNGGYSFLLKSLWNHELEFTEEQKKFAEKEAMFKIGTTYYNKQKELFSQKLDEMGVSDDTTTMIDIDGSINPIGEKAKAQYINSLFYSLSDKQAHGVGNYDIRYCILRNPNWTTEEKKRLIYDFWVEDEDYDETLEQWEWGIVNEVSNSFDCPVLIEKDFLYYYQYDDLLESFNESLAHKIWDEIQFCKLMHHLRPQQWENAKEDHKRLKELLS